MNKKLSSLLAVSAIAATAFLAPQEALAKRPGVLEGKPIVVDRLELRKMRFQATPRIGMSLSQPFVHVGTVGAKLQFDFLDWLGVRAGFDFGLVPLDAKLLDGINGGALPTGVSTEGGMESPDGAEDNGAPFRPTAEFDNPAPLLHDFRAGLTRLQWMSSVDVAFTPFSGKMGLFSSIFTEYDIYIFGGLGITSWTRHYPDARSTVEQLGITNTDPNNPVEYCVAPGGDGTQNNECALHPVKAETGVKIGGSVGGGIHLFLNDWISINPEIHDIMISHNTAGLNATIKDFQIVNNDDRTLTHNLMFNLGVTFYIPPKAKRSRIDATSGTDAQITGPGPDASVSVGGGAGAEAGGGDDATPSGTVGGEVGAPPPEPAAEEDDLALEDE